MDTYTELAEYVKGKGYKRVKIGKLLITKLKSGTHYQRKDTEKLVDHLYGLSNG